MHATTPKCHRSCKPLQAEHVSCAHSNNAIQLPALSLKYPLHPPWPSPHLRPGMCSPRLTQSTNARCTIFQYRRIIEGLRFKPFTRVQLN